MKTQYEVQLESQKLEVKNLQSQLKSLSNHHSLHEVFHTFEDNVARLTRENEVLRQMNLQLELQSYNHSTGGGDGRASGDHARSNGRGLRHRNHHHSSSRSAADHDNYEDGDDDDEHDHAPSSSLSLPQQQQQQQQKQQQQHDHTYKYQLLKKENLRLVTKLKKISHEKDALKTDFEQLKQKERQFIVSSKINNDLSHRLRSTYQELVKLKNLYGMYDIIIIINIYHNYYFYYNHHQY